MKKLAMLTAVILLLNGCATANKIYPDFARQKEAIQSVSVFVDAAFMKDGMERGVVIDVDQNEMLSELTEKLLKQGLESKGYRVNVVYSSVGLMMQNVGNADIQIQRKKSSPGCGLIYCNEAFAASRMDVAEVRRAAGECAKSGAKTKADQSNAVVANLGGMHDPVNSDAYIFVSMVGVQIGFMKQLGQSFSSALLTAGYAYGYETGSGSVIFYVVDGRSGEVIWRGFSRLPGGSVLRWTLADVLRGIVKQLPAK